MKTAQRIFVLGLGKTGAACANFLQRLSLPVYLMDSRSKPPGLALLEFEPIASRCFFGAFDFAHLKTADLIILSQGIAWTEPALIAARKQGIPFINEVDIFAHSASAPILAITGSNGKSTVTAWLTAALTHLGYRVGMGGNIGIPLLDLLVAPRPDYYVIELSNFQLELSEALSAQVACLLNLSPDHLDRYATYADYCAAKQNIYLQASTAVYAYDDPLTYPVPHVEKKISFSANNKNADFSFVQKNQTYYLAYQDQLFLATAQLKMQTKHYWLNALAVAAILHGLKISIPEIASALPVFSGLPHRCQLVGSYCGLEWFNDSKGTNIGATQAAIEGLSLSYPKQILLIAGGQGKGADFSILGPVLRQYVKHVVLFGEDAEKIKKTWEKYVLCDCVANLDAAIESVLLYSGPGDAILFSPACASFDMFRNFEDRGEQFIRAVQGLVA